MLTVYRKLLDIFEPRERRIFVVLIGVMILAAFAELLSLSIFMGLLGVLAKPELIGENDRLQAIYDWFAFESVLSFQISVSVAVAAVVLIGLLIKASAAYVMTRFSVKIGYLISTRLFSAYLRQRYSWSLDRNTAELTKNILAEAEQVSHRVASPLLKLLSNAILALSIICFLIVVDPVIALGALALIGGGYGVIYMIVRNRLSRAGKTIVETNRERFRMVQEALNGLKDVKLSGLETSYDERFRRPAYKRARHTANMQIMTQLPRYVLEGLTFLILLGMVLVLLIRNDGDIADAVPVLGIFVFAIMRMLPALQQVYHGQAMIRSGEPVLNLIHGNYMSACETAVPSPPRDRSQQLPLSEALEFDGVHYQYPAANKTALNGFNVTLEANTTIGIVGGTGAGKTTFVDLILGLLTPSEGEIRVNGAPLVGDTMFKWQNTVGYVPQQIYLTKSSVRNNIAFGIPPNEIDEEAVERAARTAALHEFIVNELPEGYDTDVGDQGVRLSGGQRQRIGIARALYHDPSVLILDEATSALDTITESVVMEAVQNLQHQKTIILIAHRLSTVRDCDKILLLENGQVQAEGTYDGLLASNTTFRRMVEAGNRKPPEAAE